MKIVKILFVVLCLFLPMNVRATDVEEELSSKYEFSEIDEMLEQLFPEDTGDCKLGRHAICGRSRNKIKSVKTIRN